MSFTKHAFFAAVLVGVVCLPLLGFAQTTSTGMMGSTSLQIGSSGTSVKDLQNILKSDSSIYPQGLVTGYYGPATQQAIKNLQAKYGLAQTGVVDEATIKVIFPSEVTLKVLSPNGGETWDRSSSQSISWEVTIGPIIADGKEISPRAESKPEMVTRPSIVPFFSRASIDLVRDSDSSFMYHIAMVDLYKTKYSWKIPNGVMNGDDYRVKISVGGDVPCLYRVQAQDSMMDVKPGVVCPMSYPQYSYSDTSDRTFSITGADVSHDAVAKLKALIDQLQQIINNMRQVLNSL